MKYENIIENTIISRPSSSLYSKWRRWQKHAHLPLWALMLLCMILSCALFAPLISTHDPGYIDLSKRLTPPFWQEGGTSEHILGTDALGRDILSRIIYGSKISMVVGFVSVIIGGGLGIILGLIAGFKGGWVDHLIMRIADIQMAIPFILLALLILVLLGSGLEKLIIVLALQSWVPYARVVRGETLKLKNMDYIEACRSYGSSDIRMMIQHIFPNLIAPNIVLGSFTVAQTIEREAALSFLGLGVGNDIPSWGSILATGREYIVEAWWIAAFPGIAIVLTVLSINILGDWLRDYLDPRSS